MKSIVPAKSFKIHPTHSKKKTDDQISLDIKNNNDNENVVYIFKFYAKKKVFNIFGVSIFYYVALYTGMY